MDWNHLRFFLALARLGSVRAAGSKLGVSHSTVLRRVEALEEELTARLFDRNRNGYELTDAGRQMLPKAERIEQQMSAIERELIGQDGRLAGPVHLTCCDEFISDMLLQDLQVLCDTHPDIEVQIDNDSRPYDLSKREADIAIRILAKEDAPPEHLLGRRLVPLVCANYVAVTHAARLDPHVPGSIPRWAAFADRGLMESMVAASSYPDLPVWGAFSSLALMAQSARRGLGLAILPTYVGDPDPTLRRLTQPDVRHMGDLWLLSHPDLRDNARLRAARICVAEALTRRMDVFDGTLDHQTTEA